MMTEEEQRAKVEALRARRPQPASDGQANPKRRRRPHPAGGARILAAGIAGSGFFILTTAMATKRPTAPPAATPSPVIDTPVIGTDAPTSLEQTIVVLVPLPAVQTGPASVLSSDTNTAVAPVQPPQIVPQQTVPAPVPVATAAPRRAPAKAVPRPAPAATTKTSGR